MIAGVFLLGRGVISAGGGGGRLPVWSHYRRPIATSHARCHFSTLVGA